jgi:hypothetical protein
LVLQPLKEATKRLEGRSKSGRFSAIYEVIPVFEYLLDAFKEHVRPFEDVDYEQYDAPEDHLAINSRGAWAKVSEYFSKLNDSPVYYAACCLHPYYKRYCARSWSDKPDWLAKAAKGFPLLYGAYVAPRAVNTRCKDRIQGAIDEAIAAVMGIDSDDDEATDEYERWRRLEPRWSFEQYSQQCPIKYWIALKGNYPTLSRFAIDILSIPASSCECERMFSELGDLLKPRRRNLGPQLLAALQCIRAWIRIGMTTPGSSDAVLNDSDLARLYDLSTWEQPPGISKLLPQAYPQYLQDTQESRHQSPPRAVANYFSKQLLRPPYRAYIPNVTTSLRIDY